MSDFEKFEAALKRAANHLKSIPRTETIRLVSNLDADGITAASIMVRVMERLNFSYSITILHQLQDSIAKKLAEDENHYFIFCDLGSGQIGSINKHLFEKSVIILDHHEIQGKPAGNVIQINPHDYGFEGSSEISAAGVCFFFAKEIDKKNEDLAYLAIIGAMGDVQEKHGFKGLNKKILEIALREGEMQIERGLRLYGLETRPLDKLLTYGNDVEIPGVTGNHEGAIRFLKDSKIKLGSYRFISTTFGNLDEKDKKIFIDEIISARKKAGIENAEDVFTDLYIINGEEGVFRDAKEFATLLNSCGRLNKSSVGIGACLKDKRERTKALASLKEYKRTIVESLNWYKSHLKRSESRRVIRDSNYLIINAKEDILHTIVGTIASIISKGNELDDGVFVLSLARNKEDGMTKVSLRITGNPDWADLKSIIVSLTDKVGGEAGGHQYAAGAVIDSTAEDEFIEKAREIFLSQQNNKKRTKE